MIDTEPSAIETLDTLSFESKQTRSELALAGIETVFFVSLLMLIVTSFVISLARLSYAKATVDSISYSASRFETITLSSDLPTSITEAQALGSKVQVVSTTVPKACSYVTVTAQTSISLLPVPFFANAFSVTVLGSSTLPTNAYQVPQGYGFNC